MSTQLRHNPGTISTNIKKGTQPMRLNPLLILDITDSEKINFYNLNCFLSPVRLPVSPLRRIIVSYRNISSSVNVYSNAAGRFIFLGRGPG
jgi:hypothetical protein